MGYEQFKPDRIGAPAKLSRRLLLDTTHGSNSHAVRNLDQPDQAIPSLAATCYTTWIVDLTLQNGRAAGINGPVLRASDTLDAKEAAG